MGKFRDEYDDDDGQVIADMSELTRTPMLIPDLSYIRKAKEGGGESNGSTSSPEPRKDRPWEQPPELTGEERRAFIRGALAAWLLIGGIFVAAFAGLILLIMHMGS